MILRGRAWTPEEKARLYEFVGEKKTARVFAAFPDRSHAAVLMAFKRCASKVERNAPPRKIDGALVRSRLRTIPLELIADRLPDLMKRGPMFERPMSGGAE